MNSVPRLELSELTPPALGRYKLLEPLGSGGMATVYRAWDPLLNLHRAVKVLHPAATSHPALRQRFLSEASTMAKFVHPNVLRIHEVGEDAPGGDSSCWYAMDLIEDGTLQRRLENRGRFAAEESLQVIFQVLQALEAAHRAGIVHRDVKPHNILMRRDGTVLLADFGSARQVAAAALTRTGDVVGTIGYMSPEQRKDPRNAGPGSDLYATGATLFGLTTGRAPLGLFEGELDALFLARMNPDLRAIVRKATRYKPQHRYPSARDMAQGVAEAFEQLSGRANATAEWMAQFDELALSFGHDPDAGKLARAPTAGRPSPLPASRVATNPLPARARVARASDKAPPAQRGMGTLLEDAWSAATEMIGSWFAAAPRQEVRPPDGTADLVVGAWEGRVAELIPLRVEIDGVRDQAVSGWVVTTGIRGEVVTEVAGTWSAATRSLALHEQSERADRGSYYGTVVGGDLTGEFRPNDPSRPALPFRLCRSERSVR